MAGQSFQNGQILGWFFEPLYVRNGCYVCCKPGVNAVLQTVATTVIGDRLTIGNVDAAVLDPSTTAVNMLSGYWASANHVARLSAECTATDPGLCTKEGIDFGGVVSLLLDRNWLL